MSTINTQYRNYIFPLKDEDLESSNNLLKITTEAIDEDINTLFTVKADITDTVDETTVDTKISTAISDYDTALDIYGTYQNGDVNTDATNVDKLVLNTVMGTPGVHTKVTVNEKGLVTVGGDVAKADISDFTENEYVHWSEVDDNSTATTALWTASKINSVLGSLGSDLGNYVPLTSYSDADVLAKLINVHGSGSNLDSDLLDGAEGSYYLSWGNFTGLPTTISGYGITDAVTDFTDLGITPTTISGYGITDAYSKTEIDTAITPGNGDTVSRPITTVVGEFYFDTTLGKPIWWDGTNWVDATGTTA